MNVLEELVHLYKQNISKFVSKVAIILQSTNLKGMDLAFQKIGCSLHMMSVPGLLDITEHVSAICKTDSGLQSQFFIPPVFGRMPESGKAIGHSGKRSSKIQA